MKNIFRLASLGLLAAPLLLASCEKDAKDYALEGAVPQSNFTFQANATEFPTVVSFTSTAQDGFLYQWNFGDNTIGSGEKVQHTYTRPGGYQIEMITAGRGGTSISTKQTVTIPDACTNATFSNLVGCASGGIRVWSLSNLPGAIVKQDASGNQLSASTTLNSCQLDDQFSFSNGFTLNYESAGQTFQNNTCGKSLNSSSSFVFRPNNGNPQIILKGNKTFIGPADSVVNKTYDILEATSTKLRLRGTNPDGTRTVITMMPYDATAPIKLLLTGGTSKTWKLDNEADAPITVGTEANPLAYFAGVKPGELPTCQSDDEFTFSAANVYSYDAKAETFSAAAGYSCSAPLTGTSPFLFSPAAGAGLAQFVLSRPGAFIAATDASPTEQVYRILEITDKKMTLRAGSGANGGTVFTIKMVAK
ncbi:PKD domain-containing protein [Hymenobacter chitinivorans]|uniref:PKD domain-containing protein n=1 Tax=Hymenobacter chitinivorans DSM 11115 TaxID=1121954 RepID=A0A2M9B4T0_9BACT|nr:PKD domain-containing protein [Hymenobacter chitinivorans]PJJ52962.1 PKD domain-containing protein [Hymenobacter chitinivorans DSM 11115]